MSKRGPEGPAEGESEPKKGPAGSAGSSGQRAETKTNPIPRLFKTQTLTFHFTNRTWEEVGPGELLYLPTCTSPAYMFSKADLSIFDKYSPLMSTFEIHGFKSRVSNILMLQDEIKSEGGTPRDVTAYTQACYLLVYQPNRINNWFKLGTTSDCAEKQKILSIDMSCKPECNVISQFKKVDGYTDFEHLTINPAKPYQTGGWSGNSATIEGLEDEKEEDFGKGKYSIKENFFSPDPNQPLHQYSCNYLGKDDYIPLNTHPSYARNLDSWRLYKYGEEFEIDINTNLDNIKLINNDKNHIVPVWDKLNRNPAPLKQSDDYGVESIMIYPSRNRPYYSRRDNMNSIGPIETKNNEGRLQHTFITMPPIKKNDGSLIKQRASFLFEQSCTITMQFPEYTSDPSSIYSMIAQNDGVVLRPGIFHIGPYKDIPNTPEDTCDEDTKKWERIINEIENKYKAVYLKGERSDGYDTPWGKVAKLGRKLFSDATTFNALCLQFAKICPAGLLGSPPKQTTVNPLEKKTHDTIYDLEGALPHPLNIEPLSEYELNKIFQNDTFGYFVFGYILINFISYMEKYKLHRIPAPSKQNVIEASDLRGTQLLNRISSEMYNYVRPAIEAHINEQCRDEYISLEPNELHEIYYWNREMGAETINYKEQSIRFITNNKSEYHIPINLWVKYCNMANIMILPSDDYFDKYVSEFNSCLRKEIIKKNPPPECKANYSLAEKGQPICTSNSLKTELFFV
nr:TPA_asm: VP [False wolf spider monodnaparvovirus]